MWYTYIHMYVCMYVYTHTCMPVKTTTSLLRAQKLQKCEGTHECMDVCTFYSLVPSTFRFCTSYCTVCIIYI